MSTIAAISTPPAAGGIAMIRMSGEDAVQIAEHVFSGSAKPTQMRGYTCAHGYILEDCEQVDEVVLTVFRAPHSYTGEDTVEITCHGGLYVSRRILGLLYRYGAEPAGAGAFTKRAFLNGKLSLTQAEAVMDMIRADSDAALRQANYAREGRLGRQMREVCTEITEVLSALTYWLDDPEECPPELEHDTLSAQIKGLYDHVADMAAHYEDGRMLREGIRTVLLGLPNAGKSTVMNWLCGVRKSIVTEYAGTTRDVITEQVKIGDFMLLLSDTAGIRETSNPIETIGVEQAFHALEDADLVLYTVDASVGFTSQDEDMLRRCDARHVVVLWNKTDLTDVPPPELPYPVVCCAAIAEPPFDSLEARLRDVLGLQSVDCIAAVNMRQQELLLSAKSHLECCVDILRDNAPLDLIGSELELAANQLLAIEGEHVSDDVIEGVFSRFCVGK